MKVDTTAKFTGNFPLSYLPCILWKETVEELKLRKLL